ncbi:MAG: DUF3352 domain-containing protein [Limnoraphis robusta]|uniref:DUF3352 domain-containing protein n=1 Tax=Limnoraphis robusta CCNP1315 TaxID=3110306 RepID=A0ABU5U172_9CYAN|nr:DUF3352 domain-containing protein [Limnoraphis robusta]MEA5496405.1 DUF3352 domain-containing protein [Limnoraphis robusta BA-68 BA1]MEA5520413.1 DUF3352 domain-containing protein [Limnoraphis robusta CCNP1315]MEA5539490.1 DUF3352 domain-containing protein [Limnoraphis robusta Tam1]MEA5546932.1 DUF3352 domain-containing protein [Limnoraphis robusta CCNP1324]
MKLRSFFAILAVSSVAILLLGIGTLYKLLGESPLVAVTGGVTATPTAAVFVPKTVPVMVSLLVNPDRIEAFEQVLATPTERLRSHNEFNRLKKILLANTDFNYNRDIQPWLGNETTLALMTTDIDRNFKNGEQPGYLFVLSASDIELATTTLDQFWQQQQSQGYDLVLKPYKGVTVSYRQPNDNGSPSLSTAIINRFVLVANSPKILREAINNLQANTLSLSQSPAYQRALEQLPSSRVGLAFVNLGSWGLDWENTAVNLPSQPSLTISLSLSPQGLLAQTALVKTGEEDEKSVAPLLSEPAKAWQYITGASAFAIAGVDLNHLWEQLSATLAGNSGLENLVNQPISVIKEIWGLDLPQDILTWVTGEYALAMIPPSPEKQTQKPDWIFVAERLSPQAIDAIKHLDELATEEGYSLGTFELGERTLTAWTTLNSIPDPAEITDFNPQVLEAKPRGVHATVGDYEIFTTSVEAMNNLLIATQTETLLDDPEFQIAFERLPKANDGYFFLNWEASVGFLKQQIPLLKLLELSAKPFFDHLRSLTISSAGTVEGVAKATVFVRLK